MERGFKHMLNESMPEMPKSFSNRIDDTLNSLETVSMKQKAKITTVKYLFLGLAATACIMFLVFALPALIKTPAETPEFAQSSQMSEQTLAATDESKLPDAYSQRLASTAYQVDNYIYCAMPDDGIYKINIDGTENTKLNDDYAGWLQVSDSWIYYTCYELDKSGSYTDALVKVRVDGSDRTVLNQGTAIWVTVVDDWIYYSGDNYQLNKIRTDGTEKTCIVKEFANWPCISGDWIYYSDKHDNIVKIHTDGTGETLICNGSAYYLELDEDYIYYIHATEEQTESKSSLYRIKTDGSDKSKVVDNFPAAYFAVEDNWIYYNIGYDLYKIYSDGTQKQNLHRGNGICIYPAVAGEWVYFITNDFANNTDLYKVKKDGTEAQKVDLFNIQPEEQVIKEEQIAEETPSSQENADFPKITKTEGVGEKELTELLGTPDKIIDNMIKNPEAESKDLFYSEYNRVFRLAEGFVEDATYLFESFGGITDGMTEKQVKDILGETASKGKTEYEGDATGIWHQTWTYKDSGISITFKSDNKNMGNAWIGNIKIDKGSGIKLTSGIGIGSTKEEVISKYCAGMYPEDKIEDSFIRVGSTYGYILFDLEDGKVVGIGKGSHDN